MPSEVQNLLAAVEEVLLVADVMAQTLPQGDLREQYAAKSVHARMAMLKMRQSRAEDAPKPQSVENDPLAMVVETIQPVMDLLKSLSRARRD